MASTSEEVPEEASVSPPPVTWVLGEDLVEGVVLDSASREPIAHAKVRMNDTTTLATETAEDGTFRLEAPHFVGTLSITAKGYALQRHYPLRLSLVPQDERGYVFLMKPGGGFRGVALKDDGSPVTTGWVAAYEQQFFNVIHHASPPGQGPPLLDGWNRMVPNAISSTARVDWVFTLAPTAAIDEDGHFSFDALPTGMPLHLAVWSGEVLRELHEQGALAPREVREIKLVSSRATSLSGTIELPFGVIPEISRVLFSLQQKLPDRPWGRYDQLVPIGPNGEFDSGPLPPGEHIWIQAEFKVARGSPERVILDWDLSPEGTTDTLRLRLNGISEDLHSGG